MSPSTGSSSARGYSAPRIEAFDLAQGFAVIEDLGRKVYGRMMRNGEDMARRCGEAVAVLADMAVRDWPAEVTLPGGVVHRLQRYDIEAQQIEVDLLPSWFWPYAFGRDIPPALREEFVAIWSRLLPLTQPGSPCGRSATITRPISSGCRSARALDASGSSTRRIALLGHPAYDLASMLQDARVDIAFDVADALFAQYCALRAASGPFDRGEFAAAFAILGAQRATKILGIFARLSKRDGKHGYLRHMPRVSRYLERNLQHEVLAPLRRWFDANLPARLRERVA